MKDLNHPLREGYEAEVRALVHHKKLLEDAIAAGRISAEGAARELHRMRREIGMKYKDMTDPELIDIIYGANIRDYNDPMGPSIEYLRDKRNKSWEQIMESATRPGGRDIGEKIEEYIRRTYGCGD